MVSKDLVGKVPAGVLLKALSVVTSGGKTGTTNSAKVAWYAGFGANLVTTTYVGF